MKKYYTRACNFFYGSNSKKLVKKKHTLPLGGDDSISFNQVEIFIKSKKGVKSKIINIKNIKKLTLALKKKVNKDIKKIIAKREFLRKKNHVLMGVLNLTPDSFSDGGKFNSFIKGQKRIKKMIESGADIIDIGGESTRPGSKIVSQKSELQRVKHVIKKFKENKITGELYQYIIKRMREEYKEKKNINKKLEKILRMNESNRFDFDDIIEEILTPKKMSEYTDAKLPTIASEISGIGIGSGISAEFMKKETNQLLDAIEEFIKALKKRGI